VHGKSDKISFPRANPGTGGAVVVTSGPGAGPDVFYPDDDRFLIDRDLTVRHYEVAGPD
jgi:hypothetical protein